MQPEIRRLLERQHGVVSKAQLSELGVSADAVKGRSRSRTWEPVTPHVLRLAGVPRTERQQAMVAVLDTGGEAWVSHSSAAALWGHLGSSLCDPIHLVRTDRGSAGSGLARLHTVRRVPRRWVTELDGLPVVRPEMVILQLYATLHPERAERIADSLWSMRCFSGGSLCALLDELGARGRNGVAGLRSYLAERGVDYVPPASGLESRTQQILRQVGIELRRQVDSGGELWSGRVDFRHTTLPLVVEVNSERYHRALSDLRHDQTRRDRLVADGFVVVELTDLMVWTRPAEVVLRVREGIREAQTPNDRPPSRSVLQKVS